MKTRRSPRNQMILWRALGGPQPKPPPIKGRLPTKADVVAARWRSVRRANPVPGAAANLNLQHFERWNRGGKHKWITKAIAAKLPRIGPASELPPEKVRIAFKLFNPGGAGSWFVTEANLETGEAFGYVTGLGTDELGYMDLNEMRAFRGRFGLPLERDEHLGPLSLAAVMTGVRANPSKPRPHAGEARAVFDKYNAAMQTIDEQRKRTPQGIAATKAANAEMLRRLRVKKNPARPGTAHLGFAPPGPKIYRGVYYFQTEARARCAAEARGWPTDRIFETKRGWVIQGGVSGDYAGPHGLKIGAWQGAKKNPAGRRPVVSASARLKLLREGNAERAFGARRATTPTPRQGAGETRHLRHRGAPQEFATLVFGRSKAGSLQFCPERDCSVWLASAGAGSRLEFDQEFSDARQLSAIGRASVLKNPGAHRVQVKRHDLAAAVELFHKFREEPPKRVRSVRFKVPAMCVVIGELDFVGYTTTHARKRVRYRHDFSRAARPLLCASADGRQLLILGGKYDFTRDGIVDRD